MRIGIVTPAFNVAPYIGDAIRSVLAQTHHDWTMTIVDDGSTDPTAAVAARFADPRLHLIRQRNAGVSVARNRGLAANRADAVLFLDGDDWLSPNALATLAAALRASPNAIAAVGPYARVPGPSRVRRPASGDLLESLLVRNLFANGGHVLIHRNAVDATGTFHPGLRYGEDWEYWTRLARLGGFTAAASPTPLLFVRERPDGAYRSMAARPASFAPCMEAIFNLPSLKARLSPAVLARLRRRAEAENDWIVGRELIRQGKQEEGMAFLRRSVRAAPSFRRLAFLAAGSLLVARIGPFRRYPVPRTV
ncbi:MAG: glycosyltransferase family 2 protein [Acetobacteraceae bacterium]|nr:glycosyltransferase family 2 protein [Acetobacteraceae bacterium]